MQLLFDSLVYVKKKKSQNSKISALNNSPVRLWRALMACHDLIYTHFEKNLSSKGLSYSRFQILFHIYFNPHCSATFIADKMNVTRGNISTFLKRMIEDQLISEHFEKNKKRCTYILSKKGHVFFEKTLEIHLSEVEKIIPKGNEKLITHLMTLLNIVNKKIDSNKQ